MKQASLDIAIGDYKEFLSQVYIDILIRTILIPYLQKTVRHAVDRNHLSKHLLDSLPKHSSGTSFL